MKGLKERAEPPQDAMIEEASRGKDVADLLIMKPVGFREKKISFGVVIPVGIADCETQLPMPTATRGRRARPGNT